MFATVVVEPRDDQENKRVRKVCRKRGEPRVAVLAGKQQRETKCTGSQMKHALDEITARSNGGESENERELTATGRDNGGSWPERANLFWEHTAYCI